MKERINNLQPLTAVLFCIIFVFFTWQSAAGEEIQADDLFDVSLDELVQIYTATLHQMPVALAPAIATVITSAEIKNMDARNLLDVLRLVPGFNITISRGGAMKVAVRGVSTLTSEKILVMLDGHTLNRNIFGSSLFMTCRDMPLNNVKQIEIIRGPGSALHGANAFMAVINIISKNYDDINGVEAASSLGSHNTSRFNLEIGEKYSSALQVSGNLNYLKTDGPDLEIKKDLLSGTPWTTAPGDSDLALEQTDIFYKINFNNFVLKGQYLNKSRGNYIGSNYALTDDSSLDTDNFWSELSYRFTAGSVNVTAKAYFDQFKTDTMLELFPEGSFGMFADGMNLRTMARDRTMGGEAQVDYDLTSGNHLIAGLQYEKMKQYDVKTCANYTKDYTLPHPYLVDLGSMQSKDPPWGENTRREIFAIFLQDEWQIIDNIQLTSGLRYDHYNDFGSTLNPRMALVLGLNDKINLKFLYGEAFRAPSLVELYGYTGNENLSAEETKTYEAGIDFKLNSRFSLGVNYFYSRIEDVITQSRIGLTDYYENSAVLKTQGVELQIKGEYGSGDYWQIGYTYQDPRLGNERQRSAGIPYHQATLSANYKILPWLNSHLDILWMGERPRENGDNRADMDSYTTVDISLIAGKWQGLEFQGSIHNLFDTRYEDPDESGSAQLIADDYPRNGISCLFTVRYLF